MFRTLISVAELLRLPRDAYALFDCRFELSKPQWGESAYAGNHLPGARYLHLDRDLSGPVTPASGRHPLPSAEVFARRLGEWGISAQTQVIAYDQGNGAYAARLWWMLRWLGHEAVAVLDGGLAAWVAGANTLTREAASSRPIAPYPAQRRADALIEVGPLQRQLAAQSVLLVDARGAERFAGQNESIDSVAGHVPGAVNLPFTGNLDSHGQFLPAEILRQRWQAALAGRPASELVAMCGSGVSACHNLLALAHAGIGGAKLYPGSWSEWIRDPTRPIATGST